MAEDALEMARDTLSRANDRDTCRNTLQQINTYLGRHPERRPPEMTAAQRDLLQSKDAFGLSGDEFAEVESNSYTLLDAHHLEWCFLLRDVVRSLEWEGLTQQDQAAKAFDWVIRQVRLKEREGDLLPPLFVLRRGWGTALERSLIFLSLLQQVGIDGCLVSTGTDPRGQPRGWVCGALVEEGQQQAIYLFDPRLGLPIPGPKGLAIATLAAVRSDPEILKQLTTDERFPYDVTAAQAGEAKLYLVCSLSALAARSRHLQDELLPSLRLRTGVAPDVLLARVEQFAAASRQKPATGDRVGIWADAMLVQRRSESPEEGGSDAQGLRIGMETGMLIPWGALPAPIQQLPSHMDPGLRLRQTFGEPFVALLLQPQMPRDLLLRGQHREVVPKLVESLEWLRTQRDRLFTTPDLGKRVLEWCQRAVAAQARLLQAEKRNDAAEVAGARNLVEAVWIEGLQMRGKNWAVWVWREGPEEVRRREAALKDEIRNEILRQLPPELDEVQKQEQAKRRTELVLKEESSKPISLLLQGVAAGPLGAQVTYLLALAMQEEAERLQARVDRSRRQGKAISQEDEKAARAAWSEAASWWDEYAGRYQSVPEAAAARRLRARVREALGDRSGAISLLEDLSGELTIAEKTAQLYLANQLKKQAP